MSTEKDYLSIKEVAAAAGVSTQSIYKLLPTKLQTYATKVEGKTMLKKSVLQEIYHINDCNQVDNKVDEVTNQNTTNTVKLLQDTLDTLREQLEQKDKQIAELHNLLDQEQQLNAINNKKILELEQKNQPTEEPATDKKVHWWQRLFS